MYPWWGKEFATKRSFPFFVSYKEDVDIIPLGIFPKTSRPSQASHQSSIFKIPFLLVLDWFLAWGHPYGGHGIMKQGVFKVYPVSSPQAPFLNSLYFNSSSWWLVESGLKTHFLIHWNKEFLYVHIFLLLLAQLKLCCIMQRDLDWSNHLSFPKTFK